MNDFVERIVHEIFYSILALLFAIRIYFDWFGLGKNRDNSLTKAAHILSFLITLIKIVEGIDGRGVHGIYSQEVGEILSRCVFCLLVVSGLIMFDYTIGVFYKIAASQAPVFWRYLYAVVATVNVCAVNAFSVVYAILPGKTLLVVWHLWVAGMTFLFVLCITIPFLLSRQSILRLGVPALRFIQSKLDLLFIFFMLFDLFLLFVVLLQVLWALRVWGFLPEAFSSLTELVFSISWNVAHFLMLFLSLGWSFPVLKLCSCWGAEESWDAISSVGTLTGTPQSKSSQSLASHTEKRKKASQSQTASAITSRSRTTNLMGRETVVRDCDDFFDRPASAEAAGFTIDTLTRKETTEIAALYNSMILPSLVSMKRNGVEIPDFPSSGGNGDETPRNLTFRPSQRSPLSSPAHVFAMLMKDTSEVSRPQPGFPTKWGKRGTREPASPTLASMPESPQDVDDEPSDQSGQSPKSDIRQESGGSVPPLLLDSSAFSRTSSFSPSVSDTPTGQRYIEVEPSPSSLPSISEEERKERDYKESKENPGVLRITVRVDEKYQTPHKKQPQSSLTASASSSSPHSLSQDSPSPSKRKPEPFSFAADPPPPGLIGQQQSTLDNPPPLETPFTPKRYSYRPSPGQSRIRPSLIELTNKTPKRKPLMHKQPITSSISSTSTTSTQPTIPDEEERDEYRNSLPIFNPFGV